MKRTALVVLVMSVFGAFMPASAGLPEGDDQTDQAATFAIRAIAQAGLLNPDDQYYGYDGIVRFDDHWVIAFRSSTCYRTEEVETCDPNTGDRQEQFDDAWLRLEQHGEILVIADAWGRFSEDQKQSLLAYTEPAAIEPTHLEFPTVVVQESLHEDAYDIEGAMLWAGPLFVRGVWSVCTPLLYDANGAVIWTGSKNAHATRKGEYFRSNGLVGIFGAPTSKVNGEPVRAEMPCELWTQETWTMDGTAAIDRYPKEGVVVVRAPLVWEHDKMTGMDSRCRVTLLNGAGEKIRAKTVGGPYSPWAGRSLRETLFVQTRVDDVRAVKDATVHCLAKGQSFD